MVMAFPGFEGSGKLSQAFASSAAAPADNTPVLPVNRVERGPVTVLNTQDAAPQAEHENTVQGGQHDIDQALTAAHGAREDAIRAHGLADRADNTAERLINVKDAFFMATTPVLGAAAMAASTYNYARRDLKKGEDYDPYQEGYFARTADQERLATNWRNLGLNTAGAAQAFDRKLTEQEIEDLLAPLNQNPGVKVLLAQKATHDAAEANLEIREEQGLPRNGRNAEASIGRGQTEWIYSDKPAPA